MPKHGSKEALVSKEALGSKDALGTIEFSNRCLDFVNQEVCCYRRENFSESDGFLEELRKLVLSKNGKEESLFLTSYVTEKSVVETSIKYESNLDTEKLFADISELHVDSNYKELKSLVDLMCVVNKGVLSTKLNDRLKSCGSKASSRFFYSLGREKLSVSITRTIFLCMHESTADLSMLSDFESFKQDLDIIQRSYVTRGKPLKRKEGYVHVRDTALLAPAGYGSLANIGSIYGDEYKKVNLGSYRIDRMSVLLENDKELFERYAVQDAVITLKHATSMEEFYYTVHKHGVPLTLSSVGKAYVLSEWEKAGYGGYQLNKDTSLGDLTEVGPRSLRSTGGTFKNILPSLTAYRGGRNESFMYGIETGSS